MIVFFHPFVRVCLVIALLARSIDQSRCYCVAACLVLLGEKRLLFDCTSLPWWMILKQTLEAISRKAKAWE